MHIFHNKHRGHIQINKNKHSDRYFWQNNTFQDEEYWDNIDEKYRIHSKTYNPNKPILVFNQIQICAICINATILSMDQSLTFRFPFTDFRLKSEKKLR